MKPDEYKVTIEIYEPPFSDYREASAWYEITGKSLLLVKRDAFTNIEPTLEKRKIAEGEIYVRIAVEKNGRYHDSDEFFGRWGKQLTIEG